MKKLLILLITFTFATELEVDGDLKVTGNIQSATIDSLLSLIVQLEQRITQLECQNTGIIPEGYCDCFFHTLDECGVCNGDNTTCQDCAGFPNGDAQQDMCGYCDNDSSNDCIQDCFGEWGGIAEHDICGECDGDAISDDECNFALSFDGSDDYVDMNSSINNYALGAGSFSIKMKIKISDVDISRCQVFSFGTSSSLQGFHIQYENNSIRADWSGDGGENTTTQIFQDEWYDIVFIHESGNESVNFKIYVNDILSADHPQPIPNINGGEVYLGRSMVSNNPWFLYGSIDYFAYYTEALTDDMILSEPTISDEHLQSYYNFNEGFGTVLNDLSGNGNHGTIHGATWVQTNP